MKVSIVLLRDPLIGITELVSFWKKQHADFLLAVQLVHSDVSVSFLSYYFSFEAVLNVSYRISM